MRPILGGLAGGQDDGFDGNAGQAGGQCFEVQRRHAFIGHHHQALVAREGAKHGGGRAKQAGRDMDGVGAHPQRDINDHQAASSALAAASAATIASTVSWCGPGLLATRMRAWA